MVRRNYGRKHTVEIAGESIFRNSYVINNTATEESNVTVNSAVSIYNVVISNNAGGGLKIWPLGFNAKIQHVTITGNTNFGLWVWGLNTAQNTIGKISNSIIWGNTGKNIRITQSSTAKTYVHIDHCIVQGGSKEIDTSSNQILYYGINNSDQDPYLKSVTQFDIQDRSPAIGAAAIAPSLDGLKYDTIKYDINLRPRPTPTGSNPDIGAFESLLDKPYFDSCLLFPPTFNPPVNLSLKSLSCANDCVEIKRMVANFKIEFFIFSKFLNYFVFFVVKSLNASPKDSMSCLYSALKTSQVSFESP